MLRREEDDVDSQWGKNFGRTTDLFRDIDLVLTQGRTLDDDDDDAMEVDGEDEEAKNERVEKLAVYVSRCDDSHLSGLTRALLLRAEDCRKLFKDLSRIVPDLADRILKGETRILATKVGRCPLSVQGSYSCPAQQLRKGRDSARSGDLNTIKGRILTYLKITDLDPSDKSLRGHHHLRTAELLSDADKDWDDEE